MDYRKILSDLAAAESESAFIATANAVECRPKTYFASVRTVRNLLGVQAASSILAFLKAQDPISYDLFSIPGDEKGTGGGIDLAHPEAQYMLNNLPTLGVITAEQAEVLKDLAREVEENCATRYGVEVMTPEVIAKAQAMATNEELNTVLDDREKAASDIWNSIKSLNDRRREYLNSHLDTISTIEQLDAAVPE